jgi:hypothetical protein
VNTVMNDLEVYATDEPPAEYSITTEVERALGYLLRQSAARSMP